MRGKQAAIRLFPAHRQAAVKNFLDTTTFGTYPTAIRQRILTSRMQIHKTIFFTFVLSLSGPCLGLRAQGGDTLGQGTAKSPASILSFHTTYGYQQVQEMQAGNRLMLHSISLSSVHLLGTYAQDKHQPVSMGNGLMEFSAGADSYVRLQERDKKKYRHRQDKDFRDVFWGNARYTYGQRQAVIGNETSDYLLLFPYIMSDTAGGDLVYEHYSFGGGYARGNDKIRWGVSGHYSAKQEYRKVDPRPRNIVSDLDIAASLAFRLPGSYSIGMGFQGGLYNQSNQVDFYNPLGGPPVYNMTGLESYHSRFSANHTDIDYAGGRYGASLSLSPEGTKGWHAAFAYVHQSLTRIVQLQNSNHELDINTLKYDDFSLKTAFRDPDAKLPYGVSLFLDYEHRYGQDILYGPSQNGIYPELMRIKNMVIHHGQANLQADMEWQQTRGRLFFQAFLQYGILSYRHRSPDESFNGSGITAGGRLQKDWSFGRKKTKGTKASRSFESSQAFQLGSEFAYRQGTGVIDPMGTAALKADWLLGLGRYSVRVGLQARYRYFLSGSWREMAPWNRYLSRSGHSPHAFQLQLGAGLVF